MLFFWLGLLVLILVFLWWFFRDKQQPPAEPPTLPALPTRSAAPLSVEAEAAPVEDDLTLIEGIGPKINQLCHAAGIHTFADLAQADVSRLQAILDEAKLRIADPTTWPEQARLAAAGDLEALKTYQDSLKGGRVV
ncbi:helix-hairpin-helix domain-containing protein [Levilinea saccharolytica]|uniref:helix-hairpin-helix domain-containing protein n=1 Tax=Levilinea saccharolytica TaxID=229921 RepID=UPI0007822DDC|nr:helix-hairpin-helix domain-containing protein [Levilinea saccharolytica]GAP17157.1 uncharacterized conserved protein [Levilinea saccharolytica]